MKFLRESLKQIQKRNQKGIYFFRLNEQEDHDSGFVVDLEHETLFNGSYRKVLFTTEQMQLVLMSLEPEEEIGEETHEGSQFIRVESGVGVVTLNDLTYNITSGSAIVIPAGVVHNVMNTGDENLQIYVLYSPPEHDPDVIEHNKGDEESVDIDQQDDEDDDEDVEIDDQEDEQQDQTF